MQVWGRAHDATWAYCTSTLYLTIGGAFKWFSSFPWPRVGPMGPPCLCSMGMSQVPSLATPTGSLHLPHECIKWHSLLPSTSCSAPRDSSFWTLPIQLLESLRVITSTSPLAMGASVFLTESSSLADSPCPSPRRPWAMLGLCGCQEWTWKKRRPQMLQGPGCPPTLPPVGDTAGTQLDWRRERAVRVAQLHR